LNYARNLQLVEINDFLPESFSPWLKSSSQAAEVKL